jgi:hypothetical protein
MSELFKGDEGVPTLGCRNASTPVARQKGCGRKAAVYCRERERNIPTKWSVMSEVLRWDMVIPSILWEH